MSRESCARPTSRARSAFFRRRLCPYAADRPKRLRRDASRPATARSAASAGIAPVKLQQRILQRCRGEQHLEKRSDCAAQRLGTLRAVLLVDISQPVRLVEYDEVPLPARHIEGLGRRKLVGCDDDTAVLQERLRGTLFPRLVVRSAFEDNGRQRELIEQLLAPLLAQRGWHDQQDAPLPFGPALRDDETRLNGLAKPDLVREQCPPRERRPQRKQGGIYLVRSRIVAGGG